MGRKIPIATRIQPIHPILLYSFFIACIVATISLVSSLCGGLSRKKSPPNSPTQTNKIKEDPQDIANPNEGSQKSEEISVASPAVTNNAADNCVASSTVVNNTEDESDIVDLEQPLPPPPPMRTMSHHARSQSAAPPGVKPRLTSSVSHGKFSSMSMKLRATGVLLTDRKRDRKLKHEDSIWKKQIILGEKCRVPDEDDDDILYDEKGNRISAYHPRVSSSLPISIQTSGFDQDAISR